MDLNRLPAWVWERIGPYVRRPDSVRNAGERKWEAIGELLVPLMPGPGGVRTWQVGNAEGVLEVAFGDLEDMLREG